MRQRGFSKGADGTPNISALARAADLAVETARRAIFGLGEATPETITALSRVLGSDVETWLGKSVGLGRYEPPAESAYLTQAQREALDQLIRAIARPRIEQGLDALRRSARSVLLTPVGDGHDVVLVDAETGERILVELKASSGVPLEQAREQVRAYADSWPGDVRPERDLPMEYTDAERQFDEDAERTADDLLAARRGSSRGKVLRGEADSAGEESQD
jgi:hypothetical protein